MAGLTKAEIDSTFHNYIKNHYAHIEQILSDALTTAPDELKEQAVALAYATKILPALVAEAIAVNNQALLREMENRSLHMLQAKDPTLMMRDIQNMIDNAIAANNQSLLKDLQSRIDDALSL